MKVSTPMHKLRWVDSAEAGVHRVQGLKLASICVCLCEYTNVCTLGNGFTVTLLVFTTRTLVPEAVVLFKITYVKHHHRYGLLNKPVFYLFYSV